MLRTLSNRDKQICFLSTKASSILNICFWKHLRYEILELDSGYREGGVKDRWDLRRWTRTGRVIKKTAATIARYRITRTTTKPWIFITRGDFQNSHAGKTLPVSHEKQLFLFLFSFFPLHFVNDPNRAQVYSQA